MSHNFVVMIGLFSMFCIGCTNHAGETLPEGSSLNNPSRALIRDKEDKEYQATFDNQKWAVRAVTISESGYLTFDTLYVGYFVCDLFQVDVVLDESLGASYLSVNRVGHKTPGIFRTERLVGSATLYVSTRANKDNWDKYLRSIKLKITASKSPREISPPEEGK